MWVFDIKTQTVLVIVPCRKNTVTGNNMKKFLKGVIFRVVLYMRIFNAGVFIKAMEQIKVA